ncbi:hypothetical protein QTI66_18360 [Variovorax sp. J22R133]|uniref:hypothetical protein n=1 Tax=Variovorax brevis TaxID=3053503 RepID=UPI002577151D|nr:hypothetical protein [Variovorax sp. J22R133]MDM0114123.1 hypothetical protein [Variovorax sp. J22R133]
MTRWWAFLGAAWLASHAQAGGHFDVDDAGTLDPGQCQYEIWAGHSTRRVVNFFHLGPACRVGPVELGINYDALRGTDDRLDLLGPQVKWTFFGQSPDAVLAAALSVGVFHDLRQGGRWGAQWVVPVTWHVSEPFFVHANLGQDWSPGDGARTPRAGIAIEWTLNPQFSLIGEYNRAFELTTTRAGLRYSITPLISVDVSLARIGPNGVRAFVVGLNHEFKRP